MRTPRQREGQGPLAELRAAVARLRRERTRVRQLSPKVLGLKFEDCSFPTADGHRLAAWWVPGRRESACSGWTAVIHHHYGGQRATTLPWLDVLVPLGFDVLTFDARGHAMSTPVTSTADENFLTRANDVRAALAEAGRRGGQPLLVIGQSQGAAAVALACAGRPEVRAVVMDSGPAPELWSASWGLAGALVGKRRAPVARGVLAAYFTARGKPVRYAVSLWRALARLRDRPLLWMHGTGDEVIGLERADVWFRVLSRSAPAWRALRVPGAAHAAVVQKARSEVAEAVEALVRSASR